MQFQAISLYLASVFMLFLGLIVLARAYRKAYSWFFMTAVIGVITWAVGDALVLTARSQDVLSIAALLFYIGPMAIPVFMWFFALSFPERAINKRALAFGASLFVLLSAAIIIWPQGLFKEIIVPQSGLNTIVINQIGFFAYAVFFSMMFGLSYTTLIRLYISRKNAILRTQVLYVLLGLLVASIPALITNLAIPLLGNVELIWLGPIFSIIFVFSVTVSIVKHRLFDIQLIIARTIAYLLSVSAVASVVCLVLVVALNKVFFPETNLSLLQQLSYGFLAVIVAIFFQPLKRFFDRVTNRLFYQDNYEPQAFIEELNRALISNVDVDALLGDATKVIDRNLKSDFSVIALRETSYTPKRFIGTKPTELSESEMEIIKKSTTVVHRKIFVTDDLIETDHELHEVLSRHNIAVLARLVTTVKYDTEGLGYLAIGAKRSGNAYSKKDADIIRIIANELLIAIENSLRFEEIEKFNVTLQEKVDDATKRLKRANEKLRQMDETKDEFISMASHQLRTPLTSVKGYLSMVLEGDAGSLNEMQTKLLEQSFTSSQRMVYLIADLLNLSRLKTGKFIIEAKSTNLADVIQGEVEQLTETASARNLKLVYKKPDSFPDLMLDETKIRQVIMNFVDNAIYYTPSGGKIEIELKEKPDSVEFTVKDDGIGVPVSEQHHLFSKFYRAKNAQKARPDGTGLGLFMAKKVIVAQGGAIIFSSAMGEGSTFGFSFSKSKLKVDQPAPKA